MDHGKSESGIELLGRLGQKPDVAGLDRTLFPGGVEKESVYEFYGKEGTGKTQCLLHLIATCILPRKWNGKELDGLEVEVIFIDTDYHFNIIRLASIIECRLQRHKKLNGEEGNNSADENEKVIKDSLKRLQVVKCKNITQLIITLHSLQSYISCHCNVSVLMIDSISAFYWLNRKFTSDSSVSDTHMQKICDILHKLVTTYKLVLFVTKYALFEKSGKMCTDSTSGSNYKQELVKDTSPLMHSEFLGNSWSKLVTQRMIFEKHVDSAACCSFSVGFDKSFKPRSKNTISFVITDSGLCFT